MTLLETLKKTTDYFSARGVDAPRLSAELLFSHALGLSRMDLYLNFDRPLSPVETDLCRELVRRRGAREPLQYITGRAAFRELTLTVKPGVLIPRPETESLVESFLSDNPPPGASVLDIGTGSGAVALSVKKARPDIAMTACDVSEPALSVARENGKRENLAVEWVDSDLFSAFSGRTFSSLLSNPPYIPTADLAGLMPEVRDHEPRPALDGGADGLDCYRRIFAGAGNVLAEKGRLYLEHGDGQAPDVRKLAETAGFVFVREDRDLSGKPRITVVERT